jgi:hypothetical protein
MLKTLLVVVLVILVIGVILLTRDWDAPGLGQALLDKAGEAAGVPMTATGFRFNLLKGVELSGVQASSVEEGGREFSFSLDRLVFEHRVLPLLSGTVAIDRIILEHPQFELVDSPQGAEGEVEPDREAGEAEAPAEGSDEGAGMALEVREISIRDGVVVMRTRGEAGETRVEDLDFEMQNLKFDPTAESLAALSAEGEFSIAQVLLSSTTISGVQSRFQLASAVFDLLELSFSTPHGEFAGEMQVDFNPVPFVYKLTAEGNPLDLNGMVGASEGFGPGVAHLGAEGVGADMKGVKAQGTIQLVAGEFPSVEMFTGVDEALGKQVLVGANYEATEARFQLENNVVTLSPFRFTSDIARLDLDGTVNLEGPIDLDFAVATPREGLDIDGVGANVLDVLSDDQGWVPVPISVTGTLEEPRVRPDAQALVAQAGSGLKREATEAATEAAKERRSESVGQQELAGARIGGGRLPDRPDPGFSPSPVGDSPSTRASAPALRYYSRRRFVMSVARVTEITASSTKSFEDAIREGISRAAKTLRGIKGAWVNEQTVSVHDGKITEYRVNLKVTFVLDE